MLFQYWDNVFLDVGFLLLKHFTCLSCQSPHMISVVQKLIWLLLYLLHFSISYNRWKVALINILIVKILIFNLSWVLNLGKDLLEVILKVEECLINQHDLCFVVLDLSLDSIYFISNCFQSQTQLICIEPL